MNPLGNSIVRSSCRICYNSCGVLIHMEDGRPVRIEGDPQNPLNKGKLCQKGYASLEYLNHPDRLTHPLKRTGKRGSDNWEKVIWDEALETVADQFNKTAELYGKEGVVFLRGASKGLADDLSARFVNIFGTPNIASPAPYCFVPLVNASKLTYGFYAFPDYEFPPKCIVIWGTNLEGTHFMDFESVQTAKKNGSHLIVVDPVENKLAQIADIWIRLRPGTDLVLALGMINVIIHENLYDDDFIDEWATGFQALKSHMRDYPLEKVEEITWVPMDLIRRAARVYATQKPGCIPWGNGIETTLNGFQAARAIAILRAICGNLGVPGGDVCCSTPGNLLRGNPEFVCRDNISSDVRDKRLSKQDNLIPWAYYALPQTVMRAIIEDKPYPVRAAYVQGGNPLTHYTHARETYAAFDKLDFLVVADLFMTPSAMMADIVLPVSSYLEFDSVEQPWTFPMAAVQQKVFQVGECWPDGKILNELTRKLGFHEYVWHDMTEPLNRILEPAGITFDEFRNIGVITGEKLYRHYRNAGFNTPSRKVELYSSQLEAWGFDPLPVYHEPPETQFSEPDMAKEYPLILTSRKSDVYRHSGGRQIKSLRSKQPDPILKINTDTADQSGIKEGDWVYIETRRGKIKQKAHLVDWLDPRVVDVDYGWWFPEGSASNLYRWEASNINVLLDNKPPFNREMGSPSMRGVFCRVFKAES